MIERQSKIQNGLVPIKILVCGTRDCILSKELIIKELERFGPNIEIIEGCCLNSPDEMCEQICLEKNIPIHHYPSKANKYLLRNISMIHACDHILAFWNGFSYGTAQTIAQGVLNNKPITIVRVKKRTKQLYIGRPNNGLSNILQNKKQIHIHRTT